MNDLERKTSLVYHALPPGFTKEELAAAYALGLLPKAELEDGALYHGECRNAGVARWDAARQRFVYQRTKFGRTFAEDIVHPEDDDGYDVFTPVQKVDADHPLPA